MEARNRQELKPYRKGVGLLVFNGAGRIFVGNRIDHPKANWQMPQGGIDPGETPRVTAMRELEEEIGTNKVEIVRQSRNWYHYEFPSSLSDQAWNGRFRGQKLCWFAMRFTGTDQDIRLDKYKAEFDAWKWIRLEQVPNVVVEFKRHMYMQLVEEFRTTVISQERC